MMVAPDTPASPDVGFTAGEVNQYPESFHESAAAPVVATSEIAEHIGVSNDQAWEVLVKLSGCDAIVRKAVNKDKFA